MRALSKRGWPGGLPLVGEEGGAQLWELAFRAGSPAPPRAGNRRLRQGRDDTFG